MSKKIPLKYFPIFILIILTLATSLISGVIGHQQTQVGAMMTQETVTQEKQVPLSDWSSWLALWSRDLLSYLDPRRYHGPVAKEMIASGWLGYTGATEDQITNLEKRLGKTLPPSYRAFLKSSNGFQQPGMFVPRLLTVDEVDWFRVRSRETIDMWKSNGLEDLTDALAISPFNEDVYLLNPGVVTADGEWEALDFSPGGASCNHYSSFWELMQAERKTFLAVKERIASGIKPDDDLELIALRFTDLIKHIDRGIQESVKFQEHHQEELKRFLESEVRAQEAQARSADQQSSEGANRKQSGTYIVVIKPVPPQPANPQPIKVDGSWIMPIVPTQIRERLELQLDHATGVVEGMTAAKSRVADVTDKSKQPEVIAYQLRSLMQVWTAKYLEQMQDRTGNLRKDREIGLSEGHSRVAGSIRSYLNEPHAVSWDDLKTRATASIAVGYSSTEDVSANVVIIVNIDGVVTRAYYVNGDEKLGRAAAKALKQWRFHPYEVNGYTVDKSCEILVRHVDDKIELLPTESK
jgi:SMI1 / KNR4 family (SUKH-1)